MAKPDSLIAKGAWYQAEPYDENTSGNKITGALGSYGEVTYTLFTTSKTDLSDQIPDYSEISIFTGSVQIRSERSPNKYWVTHHGATIVSGTWSTKGDYLKDGVKVSLAQALPGTYFNSRLKDAGKMTDGDLVLHMQQQNDIVPHNFWIGNINIYLTYYPPYFLIEALSSNETRGSATYNLSKSQPIAGTSVTFTATPNPGYYFSSWFEDGVSTAENTINLTDNMVSAFENFLTRTANFGIYTYSISYNLNGSDIYPVDSISNQTIYTVETDSFTLTNPTRPGYTFKGWSGTDLTGDTNLNVTISKGSTGDRTYTANWEPNHIIFEYYSNNGSRNTKFQQWDATPEHQYSDTHWNFSSGDYKQTYLGYKPKKMSGASYGGWYNTKPDGSGINVHEDCNFQDYLDVCRTYEIDYYTQNTTIPIYCQWEPEILVSYDTIFNYFDWYRREISGRSNCSISNVTEQGFTITSNSTGLEGTVTSPMFLVEAGKKYKIDIDITGNNWDVYIFFQDNNGTWLGTDANSSFSSSGTNSNRIFEAPADAIQAQIRVDANGTNNTVRFENFRIYPADYYYMRYTVPETERSDCGQWSAPANPTRGNNNFYKFKHWSKDPGLEGKNTPVTTSGEFPTEDTVLFSQWDKRAPRIFIQEANKTGGKAAPIAQLYNKPIRKAFIYTTDSNKWREC